MKRKCSSPMQTALHADSIGAGIGARGVIVCTWRPVGLAPSNVPRSHRQEAISNSHTSFSSTPCWQTSCPDQQSGAAGKLQAGFFLSTCKSCKFRPFTRMKHFQSPPLRASGNGLPPGRCHQRWPWCRSHFGPALPHSAVRAVLVPRLPPTAASTSALTPIARAPAVT